MTELITNQIVEAETRELSAYGFDSETRTLVGMGNSRASVLSPAHFDSDDRTLVGMGPTERAQRVRRSRPVQAAPVAQAVAVAQEAPESTRAPQSESPGPFIASDDDHEIPEALPLRKSWTWLLALPVLLAAAGAVVAVRGFVPHITAPRTLAAAIRAPQTTAAASPPIETPVSLTPEPVDVALPALAPSAVVKKAPVAEPLVGELDITPSPGASFLLDGRPFGKAPRVVQLPPGQHTVLFIHPQRGRMSVTVNVRAGHATSASAAF